MSPVASAMLDPGIERSRNGEACGHARQSAATSKAMWTSNPSASSMLRPSSVEIGFRNTHSVSCQSPQSIAGCVRSVSIRSLHLQAARCLKKQRRARLRSRRKSCLPPIDSVCALRNHCMRMHRSFRPDSGARNGVPTQGNQGERNARTYNFRGSRFAALQLWDCSPSRHPPTMLPTASLRPRTASPNTPRRRSSWPPVLRSTPRRARRARR